MRNVMVDEFEEENNSNALTIETVMTKTSLELSSADVMRFVDWIRVRLDASPICPRFAAIFGSIARGSVNPSDCDLICVIEEPPEHLWRSISATKKDIRKEFEERFGLPLSVTIMTTAEAKENTQFNQDVFNGPMICVVGTTSNGVTN